MAKASVRLIGLFGLLLIAGCSYQVALKYDPIVRGAEDPTTTVKLTVVDERAPDFGGTDKTEVGRVRGGYGNPFPLYESDSHRVALLVQDATSDALRLSRVAVGDNSERTLVATVRGFWLDGYMGYKATVEVDCALQDGQGNVLWKASISGGGGGVPLWSPSSFVAPTFQKALADYADHAVVQFNSPAFQKYLF